MLFSMLFKMFLSEYRFFIKQPSFYITAAIFFILPLMMMSIDRINIAGSNVLKNSPISITVMMAFFGTFSMFLVINFVANTAMRNHLTQMDEILYCKPIPPLPYQLGRFLGAFAVVVNIYLLVPFGLLVGTYMPWVDEALYGENRLINFVVPLFYLALPSLLVLSCCFYALALRFRSMMPVYLFALALFVGYDLSEMLFTTPGFRQISALLDPFGLNLLGEVTRYWTTHDNNHRTIEFSGMLLQNRLLWLSIGIGVLILFGQLFRPLGLLPVNSKKQRDKQKDKQATADKAPAGLDITAKGESNITLQQLWASTKFEFKQVLFTPSFLLLSVMAATLILIFINIPSGMFGSSVWPLTQTMVRAIQAALNIIVMVVITFYSAEVIWREHETGIGDVIDSLPVSNLNFWLSKLFAVWAVILLLIAVGMGITVSYQLVKGFGGIDITQYLVSLLFFYALPWCLLVVLAFLLQVLSNNKYTGMALYILFILSGFAMEPLGLGHNMFRFSKAPPLAYSDMNGFGWLLTTQSWYMLYWGALALAMSIIGYGLWHRGPHQALRQRMAQFRYQISGSGLIALGAAFLVFISAGSYIFYNTTILNEYQSASTQLDEQAEYEKDYIQCADAPLPTLTAVNAAVDIYPEARTIIASAAITLVNKTNEPIRRFLINMPDNSPEASVSVGDEITKYESATASTSGRTMWFEFNEPMLPGEVRGGLFKVKRQRIGFVDREADVNLLKNGTFINNMELFPTFGYQSGVQIQDRNERRKRDLPPPNRAHKLEDERYYQDNAFGKGAGFIDFETTISTSADQIAIAPGYLQKQWTEENRAYFHYKMDAPINNYYAFLSARFEVLRTEHKGVSVEVYHHASHDLNINRMVESIKASLDYYGEKFGPYQHKQARIIEFPGYRSFAQSFANTIPFSERIGFFADLRDTDKIDPVYFVTAHEMAHQWWGGQVTGANVQGETLLSESLAHYSALRINENRYGKLHSRKILKFELDRYLRERSDEMIEELPWMRVENQGYIHYRKGIVTMNAIREKFGEQRLDAVLSNYLRDFKYQDSPYPTTLNLSARLAEGATAAEREFLDALFTQITLFDIKLIEVASEENKDGTFDVMLNIDAKRFSADGQGEETALALDQLIDIAISSENPDQINDLEKFVHMAQYRIKTGTNNISFNVRQKPKFAVLDPFIKLVDRDTDDNYLPF